MTDIQSRERVPCPACGEPSPTPTKWPDPDPWACSPCRAAHAGAIHVTPRWPHFASDFFLEGPCDPAALRSSLVTWAHALARTVAQSLELADYLDGDSDAEAVAHAVMGGAPPWRLSLTPGSGGGFTLLNVPPDVARRLATVCGMAEGPHLPEPDIAELLRAAGGEDRS